MIASLASTRSTGPVAAPVSPQRQNFADLGKALRSGDLDAAKQAYANVVRDAREGATWPKGSNFADLGKALVQGDLGAARTAFASMVKSRLEQPLAKGGNDRTLDNATASVPSSTGGDSGSVLNVVA